ncbi:hypothetical protein M2T82_09180 [Elizabethkingia ursingii]|uniref:hypothetical protein n=1 Tax=Elizabethkingia ursingii TaxID=1756150 RepID=UPI0020115F29|nr:hypothetical protein [Elizabethkingia ursingii]MCL1668230.1 hypothetical protein [Elizabethkingia ursingii]
MTVFFCILGVGINKRIDIDLPILPRVGEEIYIDDFIPDIDYAKVQDDILVVDSIQWMVLDGEACATIFLEHEEREKLSTDFIKIVN